MAMIPQLGISLTVTLTQAQIKALYSSPLLLVQGGSGYILNFQKAIVIYSYKATSLTIDSSSLIQFTSQVGSSDPILVSNQLTAASIFGQSQSVYGNFVAANPYPLSMATASGNNLYFGFTESNPTGGDSTTTAVVNLTYDIVSA